MLVAPKAASGRRQNLSGRTVFGIQRLCGVREGFAERSGFQGFGELSKVVKHLHLTKEAAFDAQHGLSSSVPRTDAVGPGVLRGFGFRLQAQGSTLNLP